MKPACLLIIIALGACSNDQQASVKRISSEADTGGALAVYRHMDKMDQLAAEMKMGSPIEPLKKEKK